MIAQHIAAHTASIKKEALRQGFGYCGISRAVFLEEEAPRLESWLKAGMHGQMQYMENHFDKRLDPRLLVPGARSVISLLLNYHTEAVQEDPEAPKISTYAYAKRDYHQVIKDKLFHLLEHIREEIGEVNGRVFVDSAPVLDRAWAARSGLGWIGKNGNLINRQQGSWFFIAELIVDLELEYDHPMKNYCGTCTACIDACPTEAILKPSVVDGSKCISYLTIELRDEMPTSMKGKLDNWAFGCDVCQQVCPWNRFAVSHSEPEFSPNEEMLQMSRRDWYELTEETFGRLFRNAALKRTKFEGLKKNLTFLQSV